MRQVALTIAGFDPSSGAGITADLAVFAAHGLYGTACITATTVQSTRGVRSIHVCEEGIVRNTLAELEADLPAVGIKIGMLGSEPIVSAVAAFLESAQRQRTVPVVLDPVLRSSSGYPLLCADALATFKERLLPLVRCVTPNRAELAHLLGRSVARDGREIEADARELQTLCGGSTTVIVTGGDLAVPEDLVLSSGGSATWLSGEHIATASTHGTGCAFSSGLLASMIENRCVEVSAKRAKAYVQEALRRAPGLGTGQGPLELLWPLRKESA